MAIVFEEIYGVLTLVVLALVVLWYLAKRKRLKREGKDPKPFRKR